jgi:prevent-host-death family protein
MTKAAVKRKPATRASVRSNIRQIAAGEFKAKCLAILDEVNQTGQEVIITKRGTPTAKLIPFRASQAEPFIGRLEGVMQINGDPDDLVNPIFPLEDWDMLK